MFEITLITMGKLKEKFYLSAAAEYAKRLQFPLPDRCACGQGWDG